MGDACVRLESYLLLTSLLLSFRALPRTLTPTPVTS